MTRNIRWAEHFFKSRKYLTITPRVSEAECLQLFNRRLRTVQLFHLTSNFRLVCAQSHRSHIACQHNQYHNRQPNFEQHCHCRKLPQ